MEPANPDSQAERKQPPRCADCGKQGEYRVDIFGIQSEEWKCRECHEQACRRKLRHDYWHRYGY